MALFVSPWALGARPSRPLAPMHAAHPMAPVSKALAAVLIPAETFGMEAAVGILESEVRDPQSCSFLDETGRPLNCGTETTNIGRIRKWVHAKATVLELGAQYGMTSCEIAKAIQNSGRVVTIEPNPRVWSVLHRNLLSHNCSAHVLQGGLQRGGRENRLVDTTNRTKPALDWRQNLVRTMLLSTVSQKAPPLEEHPDTSFISNSTETQNSTGADVRRVPHVKLSTLLEESGLSFDTIVANCEGCLKAVLESFPQVLETMHTVIFDAGCAVGSECCRVNQGRCVDYEAEILPQLLRAGFEEKVQNTSDDLRGGYVFTRDGWEMDGWLWAGNSDDLPDDKEASTLISRGQNGVMLAGNSNATAAAIAATQLNATAGIPIVNVTAAAQLTANATTTPQMSARDENDARWWDPNIWMLQQRHSRFMNR